jgi:hypothetical protein
MIDEDRNFIRQDSGISSLHTRPIPFFYSGLPQRIFINELFQLGLLFGGEFLEFETTSFHRRSSRRSPAKDFDI